MLSGFELYPRWVPLLIILISKERGLQGTLLKRGLKLKLDISRFPFSSVNQETLETRLAFPSSVSTLYPPFSPNQGWENGAFWGLRGFILDGDLRFHFILPAIVVLFFFLRFCQLSFCLFGFPCWKSSDPKIIGVKTYLFRNFNQKKGFPKILGGLF